MAQTVREIIRNGLSDIEPVGTFVTKRGDIKVVWPIAGGAEDGDGGAGDGGAGGSDGGTGSEDQGGKDGDKPDEGKKPEGDVVSKEEFESLKKRMQAADKAKSDAEAKVKEYEDKDKSDLEKAQSDLETATKERDALGESLKTLRIENAFLASNKYSWHNPARALQVVDLSGVTIEDDGKVVGLDKALDALAKSDPYLLKTEADGEDGKGGKGGKPDGSSGSGVGSGKDGKGNGVDKAALAKKYPALNR